MNFDHVIWVFVAIAAVIGAGVFFRSDPQTSRATFSGRVTYVYDGDTLKMQGQERRIRLFGLDAPEKGQNGHREATSALMKLVLDRQITCEQMTIDRYGRIVGRCVRSDGKDISKLMIQSGTAKEYCRYSRGEYGGC